MRFQGKVAAGALLFLLAGAGSARGQVTSVWAETGASWEIYSFGDAAATGVESVALLTAPFGVASALGTNLLLRVSGAWARGELRRTDGTSSTLAGPTDTEVRLSTGLGVDGLTVSAVGLIPTGAADLEGDQIELAGLVSADVLPFRISNWGSGGGFGANAAFARPVGTYAFGASAGYVVAAEFDPITGSGFRYRPGNQLHLGVAADRNFGPSGKTSLSLSWQTFGTDEANGANLFRAGNRVQVLTSHSFPMRGTGSAVAWLGWLHRGEGEFLQAQLPEPVRDLWFAGFGARMPWGDRILEPVLDVRVQQRSERDSGLTVGLGGAAEVPMGAILAMPRLKARFGTVDVGPDQSSGFVGAELGLTVRYGTRPR